MLQKKLHMFFTRAQRTELSPELLEQMAKVDDLSNHARLLIERIRRCAQPNKIHRSADPKRLLAPDGTDERQQLITAMQEGVKGCFNDNPTVVNFVKAAIEAEEEMQRNHDRFLRQVQCYTVNELKKFIDVTYVEIRQAYDELNKRRTAYDYARERLKKCGQQDLEQRGAEATAEQRSFEQQANVLYELLVKIPDYQMTIAKTFHIFVKAESEYSRLSHMTLRAITDPDQYPSVITADTSPKPASPDQKKSGYVKLIKPKASSASPAPSEDLQTVRTQSSAASSSTTTTMTSTSGSNLKK